MSNLYWLTETQMERLQPAVKKGGRERLIGLTKGGMNTKLYAVTDTSGRPIRLFIPAGQASDYTGAAALMNSLSEADWLLADTGYDSDWFCETLAAKGTKPCIPGRTSRKKTIKYDKRRYKRRHRIERMFGGAQGLAMHLNPLRQIPNRLPLCNCSRSSR